MSTPNESASLADVADRYDGIAAELRLAAAHADTAAGHYREALVPRGCAHAFALEGHLLKARQHLEALAMLHAEKSRP